MFQGVYSSQNLKSHKQIILPIFPPSSRIFISTSPPPGRSEDRIPVGGEIFRARPDRPGAQPTSYTMGTGSFSGVKRLGRGVNHHPYLAPRLRETVQLYIYCSSDPLWPVNRMNSTCPPHVCSSVFYANHVCFFFFTPRILLNCSVPCF